jgi:Fe-S oxidoreductase
MQGKGGEKVMNRSLKDLMPIGHILIMENVLEKGSIAGVDEDKAAWAKNLNLPKKGEYTFFAGCGYQFMKYAEGMMGAVRSMEKVGLGMGKMVGISKAFSKVGIDLAGITAKVTTAEREDPYTRVLVSAVSVLQKLGVNIGYMDKDEPCCGSPLYYSGFFDESVKNANAGFKVLKSFGIKKIIGFVPACTSSLRNLYPRVVEDYDLEVQHFFEIVVKRLRETQKRPKLKEKLTVTYHEPCQLSRYLGIISEPREIMNSIEGLEFRELEPEQCGQWSTCCGGGGLEISRPELSQRLGIRRVQELLMTGASVIATSCPACMMQLKMAAQKLNADVQVVDLVELLDEALGSAQHRHLRNCQMVVGSGI